MLVEFVMHINCTMTNIHKECETDINLKYEILISVHISVPTNLFYKQMFGKFIFTTMYSYIRLYCDNLMLTKFFELK